MRYESTWSKTWHFFGEHKFAWRRQRRENWHKYSKKMRLENGFRSLDSTKRNHKMRFRENCTCQRNQRIKGNGSCILKKEDWKLICTLGPHYDRTDKDLQYPMGRGKTNVFFLISDPPPLSSFTTQNVTFWFSIKKWSDRVNLCCNLKKIKMIKKMFNLYSSTTSHSSFGISLPQRSNRFFYKQTHCTYHLTTMNKSWIKVICIYCVTQFCSFFFTVLQFIQLSPAISMWTGDHFSETKFKWFNETCLFYRGHFVRAVRRTHFLKGYRILQNKCNPTGAYFVTQDF